METGKTVLIGEIVSAVGIKGEVKVKPFTDSPSRFGELKDVYVGFAEEGTRDIAPENLTKTQIEKSRIQGNMAVVKLSLVNDRTSAEQLKKAKIYIYEDQLKELPEDTYYIRDLIGLRVFDVGGGKEFSDDSTPVGTIKDVLQSGPQDIYVIDAEGKEVMVPVVKEFVKDVIIRRDQPSEGYVLINFIEGML